MFNKDPAQLQALYDVTRKWFAIIPAIVNPINFIIDAPFGRFTPKDKSIFLLDGIKTWIFMELVSPACFLYTFLNSPLSPTNIGTSPPLTLSHPPTFLALLYLLHYLNRAIISPLRTPSRSKSHIIVPLSGISFNVINGCLMGSYLSSPPAQAFLNSAFSRPTFWIGITMWAFGLVGNIYHDEILLNIRRKAKLNKKTDGSKTSDVKSNANKQEHYAIPQGALYSVVSYPNYFCEWSEWLGFAIAASPFPSIFSTADLLATLTPPYLFFLSEVFLMIPRAYKGHKWYLNRFPEYPKNRKVVIPFLF
ncbi:hypothetical protein NLI96_g8095 [Meripilus lineatus]|uniref:3-oxo-5-alpha-steroid 4-dehydrogenase C-terminal domain-containing protein n=1 Tax=Meripilus lineatus TaxID=2056292 RepID=A0AAD5UY03_9APHY|nr:hypothetical protein NLI96_g8095 [Physisporinus lineatus]